MVEIHERGFPVNLNLKQMDIEPSVFSCAVTKSVSEIS